MELNEFRAKVFELLEKHGHIEQNGELYYPQSAIIEMMEWFYEESGIVTEAQANQLIAEMLNRVAKSWFRYDGPVQEDHIPPAKE